MEVFSGVYQFNLQRISNCFFVAEPVPTLVDCGPPQQAGRIASCLAEIDRSVNDVRRLLLTHADLDHIGSAQDLCRVTGMQAYLHPLDAPYALGLKKPRPQIRAMIARVLRTRMRYGPPQHILPLNEGQRIDEFLVVHTPGHTPGHVSFIWNDVLFAGDAFVTGEKFKPSPRLLAWDIAEARRSLNKLLEHDFSRAVSGHGKPAENAKDKLYALVRSL